MGRGDIKIGETKISRRHYGRICPTTTAPEPLASLVMSSPAPGHQLYTQRAGLPGTILRRPNLSTVRSGKLKIALASLHWFSVAIMPSRTILRAAELLDEVYKSKTCPCWVGFQSTCLPAHARLTDSKYALSLGLGNWLSRRCQGIPGSSSTLKSVNLRELLLPARGQELVN